MKGLKNLSLTCYMNSALQCLFTLKSINNKITKMIKKNEINEKNKIIKEYDNLINNKDTNTEKFWCEFVKNFKDFNNYRIEYDSSEFLITFLDYIHENTKREYDIQMNIKENFNFDKVLKKSIVALHKYYLGSYSVLDKYLIGQLCNIIQCNTCYNKKYNFEMFSMVSIEMKSKKIDECLNYYTGIEDINEYKCDNCNNKTLAFKYSIFYHLNKYLIIQIKRGIFHNGSMKKITNNIDVPFILDMSKYYKYSETPIEYELIGMICHSGRINSGHYTSIIKNNKEWYLCDDLKIEKVNNKFIEKKSNLINTMFFKQRI